MLILACLPLIVSGQRRSDTMTGVFDERIKSLQVRLDGDDFAPAIAILGSNDRIRIDFDHLAEDREYFRYSLTHCNATRARLTTMISREARRCITCIIL